MILWRLVPARWCATALDGQGAAIRGARWNSAGLRAVYLSLDPATTVLETLTTFSRANVPAGGYRLLQVEYRGGVEAIELSQLPAGWDRHDDATIARTVGDSFLLRRLQAVMLVPSVVLKQATNAVLNPIHADAALAKVVGDHPFEFDPRWPLK